MSTLGDPVQRLRLVGLLEAGSYLVLLLIAVPLKYAANQPEPVRIFGSLHGLLFVLYGIALLLAWRSAKWPFLTLVYGGIASVVPFGPIVFDRWLSREHQAS